MKIACDPEAEAGSHRCRPSTKPSGWDTTLSKTHDMSKKSRATREQPGKLFAILAKHTEFAKLMCIYTTSTRARKPSIIPKLVRLSQGNHGINWTRTPWSRLVGGVYSLSLILACSTTRPGDTCVNAVNLADIPRCVACAFFWVHLFETFDCVFFQRICNVTDLKRVNLLQEQVAATLLDPHNTDQP